MKKQLIAYTILLFMFCAPLRAEVSEIKVWSPDFKVIKIITNKKDIALIIELWSETEVELDDKIQPLKHEQLFKIDFKAGSKSLNGRWLYSKSGCYRILSKAPQNTYKVKNVAKLNQQLGI